MVKQKKSYEAMCIFHPEEEVFQAGVQEVRQGLLNLNAEIAKEEHMGLRELAYSMKNKNKGNYYYYVVEMDPQDARKTQSTFRHQKELIRFLMVKRDK